MKENRIFKLLIAALAITAAFAGGVWFIWPLVFGSTIHNDHDPEADNKLKEVHSFSTGEHGETGEGNVHDSDVPQSVTALFALKCEHNVPTYTCTECRYEIGVVKVVPALLQEKGGPIVTGKSVTKRMASFMEASGEIRVNGNKELRVSPRIPGVVSAVYVDVGARVKKGDVLFEIESVELGQTIGEYQKNLALAGLSRRNYERKKSLFEQKIASEAELIDVQMSYEQINIDLESVKHKMYVMGLGEKEVASIRSDSNSGSTNKLPYRAPMNGVIVEKLITIGKLVEPGGDVMFLADLSTVWAWLYIYEPDIASILAASRKGDVPVEVTTGAFPSEIFPGKIDYVGAVMNENSRTVNIRVPLDNLEGRLRPGMFCSARIATGESDETLVVQRRAVLSDEGRTFVFKHLKEDYYLRVPVKVGLGFLDTVEILDGLDEGDVVVTEGAFMLKSDVLREKMGAGCAD